MKLPSTMTLTTSSKKTLDTLIEDLKGVLSSSVEVPQELCDSLAEDITNIIKTRLGAKSADRTYLSMSSIGKPLRRIWFDTHTPPSSVRNPYMSLKFIYGDIIEALMLFLCRLAGHTVTDQQKSVEYKGVGGHIDAIIDGEVVDCKSASSNSYKKFAEGTLKTDDPFGYLAQIEGYSKCLDSDHPAFLAVDKVTGKFCLYQPDRLFDTPELDEVIEKAIEVSKADEPPAELCYPEQPSGTSGNLEISKGCKYCNHKLKCFPTVRAFRYSNGIKYLSKVVNEPKVPEIPLTKSEEDDE